MRPLHALLRKPPARRRGSSLIEVLVAMSILSIMVAGILQLFSLALLSSAAAAARTELLFKCQQVVENIRFCYALTRRNPAVPPPTSAGVSVVPVPLAAGTHNLPYTSTDWAWDYWGPAGANVMEEPAGGPYQISYTISRSSVGLNAFWIITVTAIPTPRGVSASRRYFGLTLNNAKRVDYVSAIPVS